MDAALTSEPGGSPAAAWSDGLLSLAGCCGSRGNGVDRQVGLLKKRCPIARSKLHREVELIADLQVRDIKFNSLRIITGHPGRSDRELVAALAARGED